MRFSTFSLASLALSWSSSVLADFQGRLSSANHGCSISGIQSVNGYSAKFYSYTYSDLTYTDTNYYNGAYTKPGLITTVANVPSANFVANDGYATTASGELFGAEIPITNFALELTGYFYGTYSSFLKFVFYH